MEQQGFIAQTAAKAAPPLGGAGARGGREGERGGRLCPFDPPPGGLSYYYGKMAVSLGSRGAPV